MPIMYAACAICLRVPARPRKPAMKRPPPRPAWPPDALAFPITFLSVVKDSSKPEPLAQCFRLFCCTFAYTGAFVCHSAHAATNPAGACAQGTPDPGAGLFPDAAARVWPGARRSGLAAAGRGRSAGYACRAADLARGTGALVVRNRPVVCARAAGGELAGLAARAVLAGLHFFAEPVLVHLPHASAVLSIGPKSVAG